MLIKGRDGSGEPQYAYAAIDPKKYPAFEAAQAAGAYDLSEFGTVLYHGKGIDPPIDIQKKMEEKYGATHDFAEKFMEALKDLPT